MRSKMGKFYIYLIAAMALCVAVTPISSQFVQTTRSQLAEMQRDEWLTQVLFSPTGKEIVSSGIDGRVVFWDATTGKSLREIALPTMLLSVAVSSNGNIVAVGDAAGNVSNIDTATAKVRSTFSADKHLVNAVAFSDDGSTVAAGGT